jgi:hypothetical protein
MEQPRLRFDTGGGERVLAPGVLAVGRAADGTLAVDATPALVRFSVDRRGVWLNVEDGARGVHVNGRPVQRMAMLRPGDAVFVDGGGMRLLAGRAPAPPPVDSGGGNGTGDPRVLLRGVGGPYHGRSITLERPRLVGRTPEADIHLDEPHVAPRHARVELLDGQVVLRDLGSAEGSEVNGEMVRDAVLVPGDQLVFDGQYRFVVEAPSAHAETAAVPGPAMMPADDAPPARTMRWPWLLLAAACLAGLLALLLLFGAG